LVLGVVAGALFAALFVRLYDLQLVRHREFSLLAERNRIRIVRTPAARGLILDRRGRPLVETVPSFEAVVVPEDASDLKATAGRLEKLLGTDTVLQKIAEAQKQGRAPFNPVVVARQLSWKQVVALETHQLDLPGVSLSVAPGRHYLYGPLGAHLLGYVGQVTRGELAQLARYRSGDQIGRFGLEQSFESQLRGRAGGREIEVDAVGRRLRLLREVPSQPGLSLVLTIDLDLEQVADGALGERAGALVAIDPNNGDLLAFVSHPSFDPNVFRAGVSAATWRQLSADPGHPLEDRAIQGTYPPGSTFKLVMAIAGLEEHAITPHTPFVCTGGLWYGNREYRCWRKQGHGRITLHRALVESCDVFFYEVGQRLGIDRIAHWAHALGLGRKSGIALAPESSGIIPSRRWKMRRFNERWYPAETLSVAIGQGYVSVTPLQMAELAAEIANGGVRYRPRFVKAVEQVGGQPVRRFEPVVEAQVGASAATLEELRAAMCDVVNGPGGTGHSAQISGVTVCGKTGTAQVVKEKQGERVAENAQPLKHRDHAWFLAFAPREHPTVAVAVVVEHGGHGGSAAGPVVKAFLEKFFALYPPPGKPAPVRTAQSAAPAQDN
jgi:penicillin-binding protein 2